MFYMQEDADRCCYWGSVAVSVQGADSRFEWLTVQQVCMSNKGRGQNETAIKSALESLMQSHQMRH
jgi:hypothetical protein